MTALVIGGGQLLNPQKILNKIENFKFDLVIACDSGYDNAKKLAIKPDIAVGDFDSIESTIKDAEIITLKPEKDHTDLRVAIDLAIEKKCKEIVILCATGGRLDHFYGNMSTLEYLDSLGIYSTIIDEQNIITIINSKKISYKNISKYISVIPIDEKIVFSTENLKYKAHNMEIYRQNIISISNESNFDEFSIELVQGKAYIIQSDS